MRRATWSSPPARRPTCARPMPAARRPSASAPATSPASSTRPPTSTLAADRVVRSKTFDNATSCSSENSLVIVDAVRDADDRRARRARRGAARRARRKRALQRLMWPDGKLSPAVIGKSAATSPNASARSRRRSRAAWLAIAEREPRILLVEEDGVGHDHPFSGEKLSPVLAIYTRARLRRRRRRSSRASTPTKARAIRSACTARCPSARCSSGSTLPVSRVIVDQAHCIATGGSFDNGLPFSLSMGCGTWGKQQLLRQHELPPLPEHHAHLAADSRAGAERGRDLRRASSPSTVQRDTADATGCHRPRTDRARRPRRGRRRSTRCRWRQRMRPIAASATASWRVAAARVGALLRATARRPGDTVSRRHAQRPADRCACCSARCTAGCCVNPVNLLSQPEQMRYVLEHSDCRAGLRRARMGSARARAARDDRPAGGGRRRRPRRRMRCPATAPARRRVPTPTPSPRPTTLALLMYTSGTTGRAEGRDADAAQPRRQRAGDQRRAPAAARPTACSPCCRSITSTRSR